MTPLSCKLCWRINLMLWYIHCFQSWNYSNFLHSLMAKKIGHVLCKEMLVTGVLLPGFTYQASACDGEHRTCGVASSKKSQENGKIFSGFLVVPPILCLWSSLYTSLLLFILSRISTSWSFVLKLLLHPFLVPKLEAGTSHSLADHLPGWDSISVCLNGALVPAALDTFPPCFTLRTVTI